MSFVSIREGHIVADYYDANEKKKISEKNAPKIFSWQSNFIL